MTIAPGQRAVARMNPGRVKSGAMPVVFDPRVGGSLIAHLADREALSDTDIAPILRSNAAERLQAFTGTVSLPFAAGENRMVAVKIVDDRGIESLKIMKLTALEN